MVQRPTVIYAGGGTGGHLFPGLAVAECLARKRPELRQLFLTGRRPTERNILANFGYERVEMFAPRAPCRVWQYPAFAVRFAFAWLRCRRLLRRNNVVAVIGLGGYASAPMVTACAGRCPVVLLEQNTIVGRANKFLSRLADVVVVAWARSRECFGPDVDVRHLGNPVRSAIADVTRKDALDRLGLSEVRQTVLVWGGSQGAHAINEAVVDGLGVLKEVRDRVQFVHQTGPEDESAVKKAYDRAGLPAHASAFMDAPTAYSAADLFVGRAGATTLAEVCIVGLPMILVPYPHAAAGHQDLNARVTQRAGAAVVIDQSELTGERLADAIGELLTDPDRRAKMTAAAKSMARPQAVENVAELIISEIECRHGG